MRARTKVVLGVATATAFAALNALAYMQARAMTHFAPGGTRTKSPEELTAAKNRFNTEGVPAPILQGGSDARVSRAQADNLRSSIAGSELVEFPGVPHMLIVEARTADWKRAVGELLARL